MILDQRPGYDPLGGLRGRAQAKKKNSNYGHAAYQIKGNDACSNMLARGGVGSKVKIHLFQNMVILHIK